MRVPFTCDVAGLYYHWRNPEEGKYVGYIKAEPTNLKDPNAIAVYLDDGRMIGYVPADCTQKLRIWSAGTTDFPVSIKVWQDNNDSYASLTIVDENAERSPVVNEKKIVLSGEFCFVPATSVKSVLSSFGAVIRSKVINRKTDYVVYESSIDPKAFDLQKDPEYHFEIICIWDLMKKILADFPQNEFYGKIVSAWYSRLSESSVLDVDSLLAIFLLESGATLAKYSKRETEIVIDSKQYQRQYSKDAEAAGKRVRYVEDIIEEYRNVDINKPSIVKSHENSSVVIKIVSDHEKAEGKLDLASDSRNNTSKAGCAPILCLLLIVPSLLWFFLS